MGCFGWGPKGLCWKSLCAFSVPWFWVIFSFLGILFSFFFPPHPSPGNFLPLTPLLLGSPNYSFFVEEWELAEFSELWGGCGRGLATGKQLQGISFENGAQKKKMILKLFSKDLCGANPPESVLSCKSARPLQSPKSGKPGNSIFRVQKYPFWPPAWDLFEWPFRGI